MINGPAGVKAHSPDCPGRRTGTAALGWVVGGEMCSCHCSGVGHHQRTRSTEDAVGAARRKEIASFWAAPLHLYLREAAKALGQSQLAVAQIAWDCLSPSRAAGVRRETVLAHGTYFIWKTPSPFTFSSLLLPAIQLADQLQHFYLLEMGQRFTSSTSGWCSFGVCSSLLFPIATTYFHGDTFSSCHTSQISQSDELQALLNTVKS